MRLALPGLPMVRGIPTHTQAFKTHAQTLFLSAATGEALTTFLAGFAFTIMTWPNISLLPALVAGFVFNFSIARPGIVNFPVDFTSFFPTAAFKPVAVAIAAVRAPCDMAFTAATFALG